jgi:hypothetical protein
MPKGRDPACGSGKRIAAARHPPLDESRLKPRPAHL